MLMEVEELMKGWLTACWCCLVTRPTADRMCTVLTIACSGFLS